MPIGGAFPSEGVECAIAERNLAYGSTCQNCDCRCRRSRQFRMSSIVCPSRGSVPVWSTSCLWKEMIQRFSNTVMYLTCDKLAISPRACHAGPKSTMTSGIRRIDAVRSHGCYDHTLKNSTSSKPAIPCFSHPKTIDGGVNAFRLSAISESDCTCAGDPEREVRSRGICKQSMR